MNTLRCALALVLSPLAALPAITNETNAMKREQQLVKAAQERLKLIEAGQGRFADDEPFVIPGGNSSGPNNKFFAQDVRFLSTNAIRVSDDFGFDETSIHGVDWASSYTAPFSTIRTVKVPLLTIGMTANWEYLAAESIYENAASSDKTIAFVEGAQHVFTPCRPCEKTPGKFGDTVKTLYDYVDGWLATPSRFL
jgi:hypothetical protein